MANLGDVAHINPRLSDALHQAELVSFVPMASLSAEEARVVSTEARPYSEVSKGYTPFRSGDILVAKITPCFENGKIAQAHLPIPNGFGSTEFHVIRPKAEFLDGRYLHHLLRQQHIRIEGERRMTGSGGQRRVPASFLSTLRIFLPHLEEQRRIAAILDQADALRAKRREALALLDELQRGIFIEMFGERTNFPKARLDELCELITDGTHQTPTYADEGVVFLSAKNVTSGKIDWLNVKYIPESLHLDLHKRLAPQRNDILLAKNGTTGVAAIVDRDNIFDIYVSLALLRPKGEFLPCYIHAAINSDACRKQFSGALKGIGVPNLHLKEIRATLVPCPPLAAQIEFESRVACLEAVRADVEVSLATLDALFSSLQHRAFRGEL